MLGQRNITPKLHQDKIVMGAKKLASATMEALVAAGKFVLSALSIIPLQVLMKMYAARQRVVVVPCEEV
jgi:hypothetical protein